MLRQVTAVVRLNFGSLPTRLGSACVIVVGIAGVTGVLIALLAMASGFDATLGRTGDPNQAIVLRAGSDNEVSSQISLAEAQVLGALEGVTLASEELYTVADMTTRATGHEANLVVRGVGPDAFELREAFRIVAGRRFEPGRAELIAGRGARAEFAGIEPGHAVRVRDQQWTVVGVFEAGGSAYESELWVDLPVARSAFRREGGINAMRLRLDAPDRVEALAERVSNDPRLDVALQSERAYFAGQSGALTRTLELFGRAVAVIMALGAAFAAVNSMHSAVVARTAEIATLKALGFAEFPVVVSVVTEALALALLGGVCGAGIAYFGFDGLTVSTLNAGAASQLAFDFAVTQELLYEGLAWALALGVAGGLLPALRAARLPIPAALRGHDG